ncbi:hypothetical protein QFZ75_001850 [Streptomyces sp. V3I8]|nr:hypothetical protein [Streptomyces sp. V3I8]
MVEVGRRDAGRVLAGVAGAPALTLTGTAATHAGPERPGPRAAPAYWTGTREAAASGTAALLPDASIRDAVHTSAGGTAVRVRVSNRLGTLPPVLGAATVARQEPNAPRSPNALSGTMRTLAFGGRRKITVPAGEDVVSDAVPLRVPAAANLLVTLRTPGGSGPATCHRDALQTGFVALDGRRAAEPSGGAYRATTGSWYYVTGVDVRRPAAERGAGAGVRTPRAPGQPRITAPSHAPAISRQANSSTSTLVPPRRITDRTDATASPCPPSRSRSAR